MFLCQKGINQETIFLSFSPLHSIMLPAWNPVSNVAWGSGLEPCRWKAEKSSKFHVTYPQYSLYLLLFPTTVAQSPSVSEPKSSPPPPSPLYSKQPVGIWISKVLQHCQVGTSSRQVENGTRGKYQWGRGSGKFTELKQCGKKTVEIKNRAVSSTNN